MAQLTDTLVSGDERVTGMIYGTQAGNYATCSSGASAVKTVNIPGFVLTTGVHVRIKFTNTNTLAVASLTLNVSDTGAKAIKVKGNNLATAGDLAANGIYEFVYDGTNWELTGAVPTSHTHGNISNTGTLTDTAAAAAGNDYVVIRDADNAKIQTSTIKGTDVADAVSKKHSHTSITVTKTATQYDGSHTLKLPDSDPYSSARTPSSHASSATTYGIGTTANYGHVKIDNSAPLEIGSTHTDGVTTGNAHYHNGIGSIVRTSVTTPDIAHINTDTKAHMVLSQITSSAGTTHDPGDGYVLTFMWDTATPWDTQLYIPDAISTAADYGRLKFRTRGRESPNTVEWGDWQYLPAAATGTLLNSSDNINDCKGKNVGDILAYYWLSSSMPTGTLPFSDSSWGAMLVVYKPTVNNYCVQLCYRASKGIYQRRLVDNVWGSWEKILVSSDITTGSANGTISVAGTNVAVKGLGAAAYMGTGTSGSTVALGNHTHSQYLEKAGGTMTGGITLPTNFYYKNNQFGIDAKNSDIINANSIYFNDESTDSDEGIHFKRGDSGDTEKFDSFWIDNGKICFVPNHAVSDHTQSSSAQIVPRLPVSVSDNRVVLTDGVNGALKTSAASSLSVGTAADYNTSSGTIKSKFDELTLRETSSSSIYGFMFKKPLDGGSWYDGYGFSMMSFYGGSGHLYEIGVRLIAPTSDDPFPSGTQLFVTVMGDDERYVLGFNSNVWYKIVNNELWIIFLTPFTSTTYTTRIHMPGVVTRGKALTTSNSTILTDSTWEYATESFLRDQNWNHKDSSEIVFRRTLTTEGTILPISKGGTGNSIGDAQTVNGYYITKTIVNDSRAIIFF